VAVLQLGTTAGAQVILPPPPPAEIAGTAYTIFLNGRPVGTEQIAVTRDASGWTIVSSGRIGAPLDVVGRRLQVRYTADWKPIEFNFDAIVRGQTQVIHTAVEGTTATSTVTNAGQTTQKTDTIAADALLVLPNSFFGPYEALAARIRNAAAGSTVTVYAVPQGSFAIKIGESAEEHIQTAARLVSARRTHLILQLPSLQLDADMWTDENARLVRFGIPAQSVDFVREDVAAVSSRRVTVSRPNDETIRIPGDGFTLAGTVSKPAGATQPLPAVVLVGGSGPADRDELVFGIPILGELANALADAGFLVVRYDKRGIGQSGGRAESASLADFAEDLRAVVKAISERKDVDPKKIAVIGHSEGGAVALLAAARDKHIAAVGLLAANGVPGADLVLAQQKHLLDRSKLSPEEKQAKIDLQKRIHEAVISGKGWDQLPADVRRQVDNAEFQSLLTNDPAKVIPNVRQPILIVQGELDTQVEPSNADRLAELARKRKNAPPVEEVKVPAVNHLLVPAKTGEVDEYSSLAGSHLSPQVVEAIVTWLKKTL
jgi:pimeloyl-ACP methyl ester carboxylesterase/spore coat protein U-like protein